MMKPYWMLLLLMLVSLPCNAEEPFTGLGDLEGGEYESVAWGISGDGSVVVGQATSEQGQFAFRWSAEEGMVQLKLPDNAGENSEAFAISKDGTVIVGWSEVDPGRSKRATMWTGEQWTPKVVDMPNQSGYGASSRFLDVNADGSVIVGYYLNGDDVALRWTQETGVETLRVTDAKRPRRDDTYCQALAVSDDGATIAGLVPYASVSSAAYWRGGIANKLEIPGSPQWFKCKAQANVISGDGSVIAGRARESGESSRGFVARLRNGNSYEVASSQWLGKLSDDTQLINPIAISDDGSIVVGEGKDFGVHRACLWTAADGTQVIEDLLRKHEISFDGWELGAATGISANGKVIVGNGVNPNGEKECWRVVLP